MKYKVTLNGKTYEVEVEAGKAMLVDEYEAYAPAPKKEAASAPAQPASVPQSPAPQGVQNKGRSGLNYFRSNENGE